MLLNIDGLDKPWDRVHVASSHYTGRCGDLDFDDMPLAMQRLYSPSAICAYDLSAMVPASGNHGKQHEDINCGMIN